jgi:uncharacterized membrane protein YfcA
VGAAGFGAVSGSAAGVGVILVSLLMASGVTGAAVIATDAAISLVLHLIQSLVFGVAGIVDARLLAMALLIGLFAIPGAYVARAIVERLHPRIHTAILDAVVLIGGGLMIAGALRG